MKPKYGGDTGGSGQLLSLSLSASRVLHGHLKYKTVRREHTNRNPKAMRWAVHKRSWTSESSSFDGGRKESEPDALNP